MAGQRERLVIAIGILVVAAIIGSALVTEASGQETLGELKKFSSPEELRDYLKEHATGSRPGGGQYTGVPDGAARDETTTGAPVPASTGAPAAAPGTGAGDYSTTNIQVAGVDEPDFIKNDGKYIYVITGDTLVIVDAYPAKDAGVVSETRIDGRPQELFLDGDRLVIIASQRDEIMVTPERSVAPVPVTREVTHAHVYSIRDRTELEELREVAFTGSYSGARMIGSTVYLITSEYVPWYGGEPLLPEVTTENGSTFLPDVYYPDIPWNTYTYHTISSFAMDSGDTPDAETFLLGYGSTLYASQKNIYLSYPKPTEPAYRSVPVDDILPPDDEPEGTVVYRFAVGDGAIEYEGMGEVPGHLLNQFSMDEYDGYLRVATTVEGWTDRGSYQYSTVSVLDEGMETVGELGNIAPGERIYATRFVDDRLYMVTFKRVDPLFVIDLEEPENPGILGELKIPGYSDYLHPYDEDHIIGIGKETGENDWGGISVGGVKLALFNVSDVNNPELVDSVEIGEAGTDSEALHDHKAFLFAKSKNLLVIPISEVRRVNNTGGRYDSYSLKTWQGVYVYGVNPSTGFTLRGTVTQNGSDIPYAWNTPDAVQRSLYMDSVLYTVSQKRIVMSSLPDLTEPLGEVGLPYREAYPRYWY